MLALLLAVGVYVVAGVVKSQYLESTTITLPLPSRYGKTSTVRFAQVSDLHLAVFGENNGELVDLVASKHPDIILATGDMIDARAESIEPTIDLFRRLVQIAPVIYSLGNHEMARMDLYDLVVALDAVGVKVVNNSIVAVEVNGLDLRIAGLYQAEYLRLLNDRQIDVLLCHFPHQMEFFSAYAVPLTFSGHTHGGQFRLPFLDVALYAPGQGLFPKYTKGVYHMENSYMIVSRGLGNSSFPIRLYNPPEVVIADITYSDSEGFQ